MMFKIIIRNYTKVATMRIYMIRLTTARVNTVNFHYDIKTTAQKFYHKKRAEYMHTTHLKLM
jgi:hypothetical protein